MALVVAGGGGGGDCCFGLSSLLLWSSWDQRQRSGDIDSFGAEAGVGVGGSNNKAKMM